MIAVNRPTRGGGWQSGATHVSVETLMDVNVKDQIEMFCDARLGTIGVKRRV